MGCGSWTTDSFTAYTTTSYAAKGIDVSLNSSGTILNNVSNQDVFTSRRVQNDLNPLNVMRECFDTEEHPNTVPIILALDVTGSMGQAAVEIAKKLNVIMTNLYEKMQDVEFCIMGIGDLYCDSGPIQISQFESDVRIAEHLDKVWFEFGGGGNYWESYTAAWYMGSRHCKLDCWKRGQKGIIITIGDERLNPYLPANTLKKLTGDNLQNDVKTDDLYTEASEKFDIYHINVNHGREWDHEKIVESFSLLGDNFKEANLDSIVDAIVDIITNNSASESVAVQSGEGISW